MTEFLQVLGFGLVVVSVFPFLGAVASAGELTWAWTAFFVLLLGGLALVVLGKLL